MHLFAWKNGQFKHTPKVFAFWLTILMFVASYMHFSRAMLPDISYIVLYLYLIRIALSYWYMYIHIILKITVLSYSVSHIPIPILIQYSCRTFKYHQMRHRYVFMPCHVKKIQKSDMKLVKIRYMSTRNCNGLFRFKYERSDHYRRRLSTV